MNTSGTSLALNPKPEVFSVCRLCLELSTMNLYPDLSLSKNPGVCLNCTTILMDSYNFKNRCSNNQERISKYYNTLEEPVDLYNLVKEECFINGNTNESYTLAGKNAKESKEVDDEVQLLDISKCTKEASKESLTVRKNPAKGVLGDISKAELKQEIDLEVENGDSPYEVSDGDSKWCSLSDDDEDMEFIEESGFKMTEKYLNSGYEDCILNKKEVDSSEVILDRVKFTYKQESECESNITKEEVIGYSCGSEGIPRNKESDKAVENYESINSSNLPKYPELASPEVNNKIWKKMGRKLFQCLLCQKKFVRRDHLDGHLLNKHKDIPKIEKVIQSKIHYCSCCVYSTINKHNLTTHMLRKHGKPYSEPKYKKEKLSCLHCKYMTYNKRNLSIHVRIHNGEII